MDEKTKNFVFEEYCRMIQRFAPCMQDYLYCYDIEQDLYYISEKAMERFAIPASQFTDVIEAHKTFVYKDDIDMLVEDLQKLVSGEKEFHNIEYRWMGKENKPIWINCRGCVIKDEEGKPQYMIGCINEIGNQKKADNISGLKSIDSVSDTLETFAKVAFGGYTMHIGIDEFKGVNERFGHDYGNDVLHAVAECIGEAIGPGQEVYHVMADEFLVVDYLSDASQTAKSLYDDIRKKVDAVIEKHRYETVFTISAGVLSTENIQGMDYPEFIKLSEFALSQAKKHGKNQVYFFTIDDYEAFIHKKSVLSALRESVSEEYEGFEVYFQPVFSEGAKNELIGAEALLRYKLPTGKSVSPMEFVPLLEESGLIIPVGKWVLERSMEFCQKMQETIPDFLVSVNVSYVQVLESPFLSEFFQLLDTYKMSHSNIIIELTESGQIGDTMQIQKAWESIRKSGVSIALDDFGTGYSNLLNISSMSANLIKLDRGFTTKAVKNDFEYDLMANIIQMVHSLGLKICVEGVETKDELEKIRALHPDFVQGYYYGRPCPRHDFIEKFYS